ncbi:uncharacterized protein METZ01_LOCUS178718, partial [marine metagenome]
PVEPVIRVFIIKKEGWLIKNGRP